MFNWPVLWLCQRACVLVTRSPRNVNVCQHTVTTSCPDEILRIVLVPVVIRNVLVFEGIKDSVW